MIFRVFCTHYDINWVCIDALDFCYIFIFSFIFSLALYFYSERFVDCAKCIKRAFCRGNFTIWIGRYVKWHPVSIAIFVRTYESPSQMHVHWIFRSKCADRCFFPTSSQNEERHQFFSLSFVSLFLFHMCRLFNNGIRCIIADVLFPERFQYN